MERLTTVDEVRSFVRKHAGKEIGLVPTMGDLHEGHASLIRASVEENAATIVSIFVNPAQFGAGEDLERYPRRLGADAGVCGRLGCSAIFAPGAAEVYGAEFGTWVETEVGGAGRNAQSEGASRPTFFRGVATVVTKLLCAVRPTRVYFGQKDAQQVAVVRRTIDDLWLGCALRVCETVRDADGVALSSRNRYLSGRERGLAGALWRGLCAGVRRFRAGGDGAAVRAAVRASVEAEWRGEEGARVVYVSVCERWSMREVSRRAGDGECVACVAAQVGAARLVDCAVLRM